MSIGQRTFNQWSSTSAWPAASVLPTAGRSSPLDRHLPASKPPIAQGVSVSLSKDSDVAALHVTADYALGHLLLWTDFVSDNSQTSPPVGLMSRVFETPRQRALSQAHRSGGEEELIRALEVGGLQETADRIRFLSGLHENDPEESPIRLESLRCCVLFVLKNGDLPAPQIGLYFDGLLSAEWSSPERGTVALLFRVDGAVRFAASSHSHEPARRVGGTLPADLAVTAVRSFIPPQEDTAASCSAPCSRSTASGAASSWAVVPYSRACVGR